MGGNLTFSVKVRYRPCSVPWWWDASHKLITHARDLVPSTHPQSLVTSIAAFQVLPHRHRALLHRLRRLCDRAPAQPRHRVQARWLTAASCDMLQSAIGAPGSCYRLRAAAQGTWNQSSCIHGFVSAGPANIIEASTTNWPLFARYSTVPDSIHRVLEIGRHYMRCQPHAAPIDP